MTNPSINNESSSGHDSADPPMAGVTSQAAVSTPATTSAAIDERTNLPHGGTDAAHSKPGHPDSLEPSAHDGQTTTASTELGIADAVISGQLKHQDGRSPDNHQTTTTGADHHDAQAPPTVTSITTTVHEKHEQIQTPVVAVKQETLTEIESEWYSKLDIQNNETIDVFPVTPLQSGMLLATIQNSTAYCEQFVLNVLKPIKNVKDIENALYTVAQSRDVLRTTFVTTSTQGICQIVRAVPTIAPTSIYVGDLDKYIADDRAAGFKIGDKSWLRLAVVSSTEAPEVYTHVVLTIHHALFDGWSLPHLLVDLLTAQRGETLINRPAFRNVVNTIYSQNVDKTEQFWRAQLENVQPSQLQLKAYSDSI
eukprot:jgi/Hompol1/1510/HPOL_005137-RA